MLFFLFRHGGGGAESILGPLSTSATECPVVPALGDCDDGQIGGKRLAGKPKYSEKTCYSATFFTINPTWPNPGSNPGRRGGKPATNRLRYGAAWAMLFSAILFLLDALYEG
jgi:hypothetical protein